MLAAYGRRFGRSPADVYALYGYDGDGGRAERDPGRGPARRATPRGPATHFFHLPQINGVIGNYRIYPTATPR